MFNSLSGIVSGKTSDAAFLSINGIEWEIVMPATDIDLLPLGREYRIFTWLYHKEDQMKLFGFSDTVRRNTFLELIKVDGIGPRGALKIMGGISQEELEKALEKGDLARLEGVPGLGKKTAQKMLLALKGKLVTAEITTAEPANIDLIKALTEMGYDKREVTEALSHCEADIPANIDPAEREKILFKNAIIYLAGGN